MNVTPRSDEIIREMMARLTPGERVAMASRMFDGARELVRAGVVAQRGPGAEARMREHLLRRFYGDELGEEKICRILAAWGESADTTPSRP